MANGIDTIKSLVKNKALPYNYIVGEKSGKPSPIPFDVKLSMDADFNRAVTKWVSIGAGGICFGIIAGFLLTKKRR